jgi:Domain of unknown function (DUF4440)
MFKTSLLAVAVASATALAVIGSPGVAHADSCVDSGTGAELSLQAPPCSDVLAQEARWLTAITSGDVAAVDSILGPTFLHVNSSGQPIDRAQEVAATKPLPVTFDASEQVVDVYGDSAVIHGINTVRQGGKVVARERFVDVFALQSGVWKALTAQETTAKS